MESDKSRLLDEVLNKTSPDDKPSKEVKIDANKLREELYSPTSRLSNIDYAKKTLQLRKAIMDEGKQDPFLNSSPNYLPTQEDKNKAENVAKVIQDCIDYADGDNDVFTNELSRRTVDAKPYSLKKRNSIRR